MPSPNRQRPAPTRTRYEEWRAKLDAARERDGIYQFRPAVPEGWKRKAGRKLK